MAYAGDWVVINILIVIVVPVFKYLDPKLFMTVAFVRVLYLTITHILVFSCYMSIMLLHLYHFS